MRRRAVAGAAAIGGATYYAAKRGAGAPLKQQAPEARTEAPEPDRAERVKQLAELREQGLLTEEEFAAEQRRLLGS